MVEPSKRQLTDRLVELMGRMYAQMRPHSPEEWADLELTMPQIRTLGLLSQGPQRMSNIAAHLGSSLSSATSMIDRLVNKQLVERVPDPADRRVVTCQLTPLGREHVERFWRIGRMRVESLAEVLTLQELETVVCAIDIVTAAIDRQAGAAPPGCAAGSGGERESDSTASPGNL